MLRSREHMSIRSWIWRKQKERGVLALLLLFVTCCMRHRALFLVSGTHRGAVTGIVKHSDTPQGQLTADPENTA